MRMNMNVYYFTGRNIVACKRVQNESQRRTVTVPINAGVLMRFENPNPPEHISPRKASSSLAIPLCL